MKLISALLLVWSSYCFISAQTIELDRGQLPGMNLYDILYTGDLYVAVGQNGLILTSEDAVSWNPYSSIEIIDFTFNDLRSIAWNGTLFIASGDLGRAYWSNDAVSWTRAFTDSNQPIQEVIWHENAFIAVGLDINVSNDGLNWTSHSAPTPLIDIACNSSLCVTVGEDGAVMTSADLQVWQSQMAISSSDLTGIAVLGSRFIAISAGHEVFTSDDGVNWQQSILLNNKPEVINVANNKALILQEEGLMVTSTDGVSWTEGQSGLGKGLESLIWDGQRYVGVGKEGHFVIGKSLDHWTYSLRDEIIPRIAIPRKGPIFLNASTDGLYSSGCARSWRQIPSPIPGGVRSIDLLNGGFIAVGDGGAIMTSPDGYEWTAVPFLDNTSELRNVRVGPTSIILRAGHTGYVRPLATNDWEMMPPFSLGLWGFIKDGQRFMTLGGLASKSISEDGYTWEQLPVGGAVIDNINFFVGGDNHAAYYSFFKDFWPLSYAIVKDGVGSGGGSVPPYTWYWRWMDDHFLALGFRAFQVDGQGGLNEISHPWALWLTLPTVSHGRAYIPFNNSNFKYTFDETACECPIYKEPENTVACLGEKAQFSIYADNAIGYQWRKNGVPIPGATEAFFTIPTVAQSDFANYDCVVQTACLTVTSARASLTAGPGVEIQLVSPAFTAQGNPTLTANFHCDPGNLTWYWRDVHQNLAFGLNQQTVTAPEASMDRPIEIVVSSPDFQGTARDSFMVFLIDPIWIDPNGDGCQDANDWIHLAPLWLTEFDQNNDPNGDGFFDIRDFLIVPANGSGCKP